MTEEEKKQYQFILKRIKSKQIELSQDNDYLEYLKTKCIKEEHYEFIKTCDDHIKINQELSTTIEVFFHTPPPDEIQFMAKLYLSFLDEYQVKRNIIRNAFHKQRDKNLYT